MAEEYNRAMGGNRWWDSSTASSSSSSSSSSMVFPDQSSLQMMGLGLSSQPMEDHMRGGFRSILQEGMTYGSSNPEFKSIKGLSPAATFSVDQFSHTSSVDSCSHGGLPSPSFLTPLESSSSGIFQPLIMNNSDHHHHQQQSGFGYHQANYGNSESLIMGNSPNWSSNKVIPEVPQFLKANSNQPQFINNHGSFWNPATSMADPRPAAFFPVEVAPPLLQPPQLAVPSFHDKPNKNNMDQVRTTSGGGRKTPSGSDRTSTTTTVSTTSSSGGATAKRSRNEASSNLPPFKVRKEKMGDRITALQQLVSPFGKTDTASVLSEAIEYIKFLHEQVNVLSTPYLKSGASLQHQQGHDKFKDQDAPRQDLRTRGLCLVPVSSTFPVAHESTVDFWTPGYGSGAFR